MGGVSSAEEREDLEAGNDEEQTNEQQIKSTHDMVRNIQFLVNQIINKKKNKKEKPSLLISVALCMAIVLFISFVGLGLYIATESLLSTQNTTFPVVIERLINVESSFTTLEVNFIVLVCLIYYWCYVFFNFCLRLKSCCTPDDE